jgi:hypothetical protein
MTYKHMQTGWVVLGVCVGLMLLFEFLPKQRVPREVFFPALILLLLVIIILMGALTVEVDDVTIRLRFGVGLVRKTFSLADVASCKPVRNKWWWGWGIKCIPGGWLYNVSGLDAVELKLKNGKIFRIGTDEPQALNDFIRAKLSKLV